MNIDRHAGYAIDHESEATSNPYVPGGWVPLAVTPITPSPMTAPGRYIAPLWPDTGRWVLAPENDPETRALFRRHAIEQPPGYGGGKSRSLPGSGDRLILTTTQADALIVFRKFSSPDREFGVGVHCAVFRNEGHFRSCSLIREAVDEWAVKRWPGERFYTYISGRRIVATNPGYAFRCAGWRRCGITYGGLVVMEIVSPPS